jgi:hypothetical protein
MLQISKFSAYTSACVKHATVFAVVMGGIFISDHSLLRFVFSSETTFYLLSGAVCNHSVSISGLQSMPEAVQMYVFSGYMGTA